MRARMWQLAAAAVLAVTGSASAQTAGVGSLPQIPVIGQPAAPVPAAPAAPAPAMAAPAAPAPAAAPAAAPAVSPIIVHGASGCSTCAPACDPCGKSRSLFGGGVFSSLKIGSGCANPVGCGNFASERTFLFGGCKQFYNPGNDCGKHGGDCGKGGHKGGGCKNCLTPDGPGGYFDRNCEYGSYLNR